MCDNNNEDWCVICVQEPTQSSQPAQDAAEAEREDKSHPGGHCHSLCLLPESQIGLQDDRDQSHWGSRVGWSLQLLCQVRSKWTIFSHKIFLNSQLKTVRHISFQARQTRGPFISPLLVQLQSHSAGRDLEIRIIYFSFNSNPRSSTLPLISSSTAGWLGGLEWNWRSG